MKTIELSRGKVAIVDDVDYERLNQHKWCAQKRRQLWHAARYDGPRYVYMHREIMETIGGASAAMIDHRDGDGLNNTRDNLRWATRAQNMQSYRHKPSGATSKYRGVSWHKGAAKWTATIVQNGKFNYLGLYLTEDSAARAYDKAARQMFGEFASTNFPACQTP